MRAFALLLFCAPAYAGLWSPSTFFPVTNADGSVTWTLDLDTNDVKHMPKSVRELPTDALHETLVGTYIAMHKICLHGWEITGKRPGEKKNRLIIEGRCK
jgi:hypothetical protein